MKKKVKASSIAKFLNNRLVGGDIEVNGVCAVDALEDQKMAFLKTDTIAERLNTKALILVKETKKIDPKSTNTYIKVANPRLAFAKVVDRFLDDKRGSHISPDAKIGRNAKIGKGAAIGANCVIGENVTIGRNTVIRHHVVIAGNTVIGEDCLLKSGSVIGEEGFGAEYDDRGVPVSIPHLGNVVIGDRVAIGSLSTINSGTIDSTLIGRDLKKNDHVHIAHNCAIGDNTIITGQVNISGSARIGRNCWLGPNCSIMNKVKIGDKVKVGIGAVVRDDVGDGKTVVGLEALPSKDLLKFKKRTGYNEI